MNIREILDNYPVELSDKERNIVISTILSNPQSVIVSSLNRFGHNPVDIISIQSGFDSYFVGYNSGLDEIMRRGQPLGTDLASKIVIDFDRLVMYRNDSFGVEILLEDYSKLDVFDVLSEHSNMFTNKVRSLAADTLLYSIVTYGLKTPISQHVYSAEIGSYLLPSYRVEELKKRGLELALSFSVEYSLGSICVPTIVLDYRPKLE